MTRWTLVLLLVALPALSQDYNVPGRPRAAATTYYSIDLATNESVEADRVTVGLANSWSISIWVKPDALDGASNMFVLQNAPSGGSNNRREILIKPQTANDPLIVDLFDSAGVEFKKYWYDTVFASATWAHIVVTWDGTTLLTYVNNALETADTASPDIAGTQSDATALWTTVGYNHPDGNSWLNGEIGPIGMWTSVLSAAEVTVINTGKFGFDLSANSGNYTSSANLIHWWKPCQVNDTTANALQDYKGTLTLNTNIVNIDTSDCVADAPP